MPRPLSTQHSALSTQHSALSTCISPVIERLEQRFLLSVNHSDPAYIWSHLKPALEQELAILEYNSPTFQAGLDAHLAALGLDPIPPEPGTLPDAAPAKAQIRHPRRHKIKLPHFKKPKRGLHRLDITAPVVTDATYYYDQALPNQLAITFDQDVTASSWDSAISVLNLSSGYTLSATGTYSSALHTVVYDLYPTSVLPDGNYAAVLHGSQITDTTHGLAVVGSDSVAGDDYFATFFFQNADVNRDRHVDYGDVDVMAANYNLTPASFTQGDADYNNHVDSNDVALLYRSFNTNLQLFNAPTALSLTASTSTTLQIAWPASTSGGVNRYRVFRDNAYVIDVAGTTFTDTGLAPGSDHTYFVVATDGSNSSSYPSPELIARTPPAVSTGTFQYQTLPYQLDFTFSQNVTASSWPDALSIVNLNTGTSIAVSGATYNSGSDSVTYDFSPTAPLADGNYAAILHGSQITDPDGYTLAGSDGVAGHDYFYDFFFKIADFNHDRSVDTDDYNTLSTNYNMMSGATFSSGDANYNGSVTFADFAILAANYNTSLPLLTSTDTPTAYVASSSSADIFWDAPSDTLVTQFDLYRDSSLIASGVTDTGYLDTGLSYDTPYNYFVVSKDASGDSAYPSPEAYIDIAPSTPTFSLSGDAEITEGDTYYLGGAFANANNDEPTQWNISWGDGTSATYDGFASAVLDSSDQIGGPAGAFHTYAKGTYTLTGSALSDIGTYAANSLVVTVDDATPTFSVLGDETFVQSTPYTITNTFTDFDSPLTWSLAWGDGSTASTGSGAIPATLTHTYTSGAFAPFTLVAKVATADGTYTNTASVDAAMPTLSVTGASTAQQGSTYTLTDTFSDPASLTATGWNIDWGDGATSSAAGTATTLTHVYTDLLAPGEPYTIAAFATDANGTYYADPAEVTVDLTTPSLSLADSSTVTVGSTATITNFSATDGSDAIQAWTIAWGDGSTSHLANNPTSFKHLYTLPGVYNIAGTATTADGPYTKTLALTVADHATLQFGVSGIQNQTGNAGIIFTDPGSSVVPDGLTISWGDGTTSTSTDIPGLGSTLAYAAYPAHIYHTYGTITVQATLHTNAGTYTSSTTASIAPNLEFAPSHLPIGESGTPLDLSLGYNGTEPIPSYTIDWGDGTTTTATSPAVEHAYTFDSHWPDPTQTYWGNFRSFSISAVEGGETYSTAGWVTVYSGASDGAISLSSGAPASEAQWYYSTATFSDPDQSSGEGVGGYQINWGDGTISFVAAGVPETVVGHWYWGAGTYNVEWETEYQDDNSGPLDQPFVVVARETVTVAHTNPTFSISGATSTVEGTDYYLSPTFLHASSSEGVLQWSIAWGDGTTSFQTLHNYATPGNRTIVATAVTNEGTYTATWAVSIPVPTLSIHDSGGGATDEGGATSDYFVVSRSNTGYRPLTVNFTLGGSASSSDYRLTDVAGDILTNSLTIPSGATLCTVFVQAVDDKTPEWTDTLAITLGTSSSYALDPTYNTAATEIVDNDLGITLGDGSGNIILQGSSDGTQNLVPLVLNFPQNAKAGAVVTLTDSPDTEADVWTTETPGTGDEPILGDVDGTYTSSVTWTYGVNMPTDETFWAAETDGSAAMDDIQFTLADSDASATTAPANPTTNTATTKPATGITVKIISKNNPNDGGQASIDVTGMQRGWLLGQMADLAADTEGPPVLIKGLGFHWSTEGNVLRAIRGDETSNRIAVQQSSNDEGDRTLPLPSGSGMNTGTDQKELVMFWARIADNGPDADNVTLTVTGNGLTLASITTTYLITLPIVTNSAVSVGSVGYDATQTHIGLYNAPGQTTDMGVTFKAQLDLPAGFSGAGNWRYVQKVKPAAHLTMFGPNSGSKGFHDKLNNSWWLDNLDPYWPRVNNDADPSSWTTGSGIQGTQDRPQITLSMASSDPGALQTEAKIESQYEMFIMFRPPGTGSQWVAVREADWNIHVAVINKLGDGQGWRTPSGYTWGQSNSPQPSFQLPSEVPQWTNADLNDTPFVLD